MAMNCGEKEKLVDQNNQLINSKLIDEACALGNILYIESHYLQMRIGQSSDGIRNDLSKLFCVLLNINKTAIMIPAKEVLDSLLSRINNLFMGEMIEKTDFDRMNNHISKINLLVEKICNKPC